jgi:hypothetical protein
MKKQSLLKNFVQETLVLKEEMVRGLPDFVLDEAAAEATSYVKKALTKTINQRTSSPGERRKMMKIVDENLKDLKNEIQELIRDKVKNIVYEL